MSNYAAGHAAEKRAAEFMRAEGYEIIQLNWRNRWCEIDIIAKKNGVVYFVEVKYRRNKNQGSGLEYITAKKLKQMEFAANFWTADNNWTGDYQLAGLGIDGAEFEFVEIY